jgi:hypothetical protein
MATYKFLTFFSPWGYSMLIQVVLPDNHHEFVKPGMLDPLIESGKIIKFKRSTGWVMIGSDPVRKVSRGQTSLTPSDMKKLSRLLG